MHHNLIIIFVMDYGRKIKKWFFLLLLAVSVWATPQALTAQEVQGERSTVILRFVSDKGMFYRAGNEESLNFLLRNVSPGSLTAGAIQVDGYSRTKELSKIRCNRIKSELIVRRGLREEHFTTRSLTGAFEGMENVVVVTIPLPSKSENSRMAGQPLDNTPSAQEAEKAEQAEQAEIAGEAQTVSSDGADKASVSEQASLPTASAEQPTLSIRGNLLRWATLTPDLGLEWRISPSVGFLAHGTWTSWSWDNLNRRYALWEVAPELRYYIGKGKRGYIGAMYKVGEFNYKLAAVGKQGNLMAGGITGGYMLRLNKSFALDFSLGAGYIHVDYDKYEVINSVKVRRGNESKNLWGIMNAGVVLVWNLF